MTGAARTERRNRMGVRATLSLMAFGALMAYAILGSIPAHADLIRARTPGPMISAASQDICVNAEIAGWLTIFLPTVGVIVGLLLATISRRR